MNTFHTPTPIALDIQLVTGDILVNASDRADTIVTVRPRDEARPADLQAAQNTLVDLVGTSLTVRASKTWQHLTGPSKKDGSLIVEVDVPTGSSLSATTGFGTIHSEGELANTAVRTGMGNLRLDKVGSLTAKSGFGDVVADDIAGDATVSTGSGLVRLGAVGGAATVKNSNGTIDVGGVARHAQIRTANGDITIGQASGSVTAKSAMGDVRIVDVSAGTVNIRTAAGSIEVGIREGAAAWLEVSCKYGQVRNSLESASGPKESDSKVEVNARTGAGDITISRAPACVD